MKFISLLVFSFLLTACGGSSSSSSEQYSSSSSEQYSSSESDKKQRILNECMTSSGVDINNPKDNVSPSELENIEKCLARHGYSF